MINKRRLAQNFSRAASTYEEVAHVQKTAGDILLQRIQDLPCNPQSILDLGSGTGLYSQKLSGVFPHAQLFCVDLALGMLHYARNNYLCDPVTPSAVLICGDAEQLPLQNESVDFIFSNCCFQWCSDLNATFKEMYRILKPKGAILFSSFGPDTLKELRETLNTIQNFSAAAYLPDLHDVGDLLLKHNFSDPVLDRENWNVPYKNFSDLSDDLKKLGAHAPVLKNSLKFNRKFSKKALTKEYEKYRTFEGLLTTFELIFGYAVKK